MPQRLIAAQARYLFDNLPLRQSDWHSRLHQAITTYSVSAYECNIVEADFYGANFFVTYATETCLSGEGMALFCGAARKNFCSVLSCIDL
jgi:hypothetical protein